MLLSFRLAMCMVARALGVGVGCLSAQDRLDCDGHLRARLDMGGDVFSAHFRTWEWCSSMVATDQETDA